jgi:hypothetical protein
MLETKLKAYPTHGLWYAYVVVDLVTKLQGRIRVARNMPMALEQPPLSPAQARYLCSGSQVQEDAMIDRSNQIRLLVLARYSGAWRLPDVDQNGHSNHCF